MSGPTEGGVESGGIESAGAARLERRYRWLLAAYPRDHRAEHAEEMLGVLMAGAYEGRVRPGLRESVNLVAGALRIRLRRLTCCFVTPRWRDALAVLSVVAPLGALAMCLETFQPHVTLFILGHFSAMKRVAPLWWFAGGLGQVPFVAGWACALALLTLGRRRGALVAVEATMIVQVLITASIALGERGWLPPIGPFMGADSLAGFFLGTVSIAALACSDGPRRGLEILGRWRTALIGAGLLVWTAAHSFAALLAEHAIWGTSLQGRVDWYASIVAAFVAIPVAVLCLRGPVGRRVMLLALPAASPFGVMDVIAALAGVPRYSPMAGDLVRGLYLLLAVAVALLAVGSRRRPGRVGPPAPSPSS